MKSKNVSISNKKKVMSQEMVSTIDFVIPVEFKDPIVELKASLPFCLKQKKTGLNFKLFILKWLQIRRISWSLILQYFKI
ncbi:hypothetical protein RHGRI_010390 [Rhododendron griersonianum]|uniref:Uncharacterized protein n=1 Tax=Rhododendron griersonianum TaxID=479676 RepID=A0AAV6KIZ4_9ERIC|nr:hypothetical protein RHGRI_010390 [Rhododendron griersonianum]